MQKLKKTFKFGDHEVILETGQIARQADAAVMAIAFKVSPLPEELELQVAVVADFVFQLAAPPFQCFRLPLPDIHGGFQVRVGISE